MKGLPKTGISYATHALHAVRGCKMDLACAQRCWARSIAHRFRDKDVYKGLTDEQGNWASVREYPEAFDVRLPEQPTVIFVAPMGDLALADADFIALVFSHATLESRHQFLFLTKRPAMLLQKVREGRTRTGITSIACGQVALLKALEGRDPEAIAHLYLGVSCSTQKEFYARVPVLCEQWPGNKWVSLEPQIEEINVRGWLLPPLRARTAPPGSPKGDDALFATDSPYLHVDVIGGPGPGLQWVVQGCESGPGRRPFEVEWAAEMGRQCREAGVPHWLKQAPWVGGQPWFDCGSGPVHWLDSRVHEAPLLNGKQRLAAPPAIAEILRARGKT